MRDPSSDASVSDITRDPRQKQVGSLIVSDGSPVVTTVTIGSSCGGGASINEWRDSETRMWLVCMMENDAADRRSFPAEAEMHAIKLACQQPDDVGRSSS